MGGVRPTFVRPLLAAASAPHRLVNGRQGQVMATTLLPAFDSASRRRGLLKRHSMPADTAMIIAPCSAIHTCFMRFPIDVAFVARDGKVLKVVHALQPWRLAGALRAYAVIELSAGILARTGTRPGDILAIV
jgi:uncharacterized protein